jgi:hypothetical protein
MLSISFTAPSGG